MNPTAAVATGAGAVILVMGAAIALLFNAYTTATENSAKFESALKVSQETVNGLISDAKIEAEEKHDLINDLKAEQAATALQKATIANWQRQADFRIHTAPLDAGEDASDLAAASLCRLYQAGGGDVQGTICAPGRAVDGNPAVAVPPRDSELRPGLGDDQG